MPSHRSRSSGPASLSSRSLSNPSMHDGSALDRKTRQPLFFECHVCILGRSKLAKDETFSANKAEVLMNHLYRKRQSHCVLYCLEDSIRFEKSKRLSAQPMRNFVTYRAIKHIFIFREKPDVFMLCIDSGRSDRRTYEAFKCKMKEDVITLCEMAFKASKDPEYKLRDVTPLKNYVRYSELNDSVNHLSQNELNGYSIGAQSTSTLAESHPPNLGVQSVFDLYEQHNTRAPHAINHMPEAVDFEEPALNVSHELVHETPRGNSPSLFPQIIVKEAPDETLATSGLDELVALNEKLVNKDDDEWEVNITYLEWDNVRGAVINDRGPIYMYVARRLHPSTM
ncbi:unnamed protein product [Echinostoma caproni]|uniref:PID domain-containing protein n=1 Tax=Echinostoma caproni TaxID=27848 RepID=A0A183AJN7_9TREM|nr:unnamed protein product [Echinostoma caproni]